MHRCVFRDRIEERKGRLCRIVRADWIDGKGCVRLRNDGSPYSVDVYIENEDGECFARYLYFSPMGGYLVAFPGEFDSYFGYVQELEFCESKRIEMFSTLCRMTDDDRKILLGKYPEFQYVIDKWDGSVGKVFTALQRWKEFPEVELLLASGYEKIALGKRFYAISEKKRREILLFLRKHWFENPSTNDVLICLKYGLAADEFEDYIRLKRRVTGDTILYFRRRHIPIEDASVSLYLDYRNMVIRAGHSLEDDYWRYPKNLYEMHDKVMREIDNIESSSQIKRNEAFRAAVSSYTAKKGIFDGFQIYVPKKIKDVEFQARILNQCLISADYVGKVIDGKCTLVFIRKNNRPVATVELKPNGKIGQFYCNEHDRNNCLPDENLRNTFDKWMKIAV